MLKPGDPAPELAVPLLGAGRWRLAAQTPRTMTLAAFYRGGFCSFCRDFLQDLDTLTPAFETRGVTPIAISVDGPAEAAAMAAALAIAKLRIGHSLQMSDGRAFGLFVSRTERSGAVHEFVEPALFLIRPDGRIYAIFQNSMSCARPDLRSLIRGLDLLAPHGYPDRGRF